MEEVNTVVLENGIEYMEMDELTYNNNKYVLLVNYKNIKDSFVRKVVVKNNQEYLSKIKDDNEIKTVISLFVEKNKTLFN